LTGAVIGTLGSGGSIFVLIVILASFLALGVVTYKRRSLKKK
jgi:hypothetical protein